MANPTSWVQLYCTKLDPSGKVVYDGNIADVSTAVGGRYNDCVFIRKDNIIRINANADILDTQGVNYVAYQNPEFGTSRVFYAFVREIRYIAQETTELVIDTDSYSTYRDDMVLGSSYIERRTASADEDIAGNNVIPENVSLNLYRKTQVASMSFNTVTDTNFGANFEVGVITGSFNISTNPNDPTWTDPNAGAKVLLNRQCSHYLGGWPVGGNLYCMAPNALTSFSECVAVLGGTIVAAFPVWRKGTTIGTFPVTYTRPDGEAVEFQISIPSDGYDVEARTPNLPTDTEKWGKVMHNQKVNTYPYSYIIGEDGAGTETIYRKELFANNTPDFRIGFLSSPSPAIVAIPINYNGVTQDIGNATINNNLSQIPYNSNSYAQYLGTHANQLAFAKIANQVEYAAGFIPTAQTSYVPTSGSSGVSGSTSGFTAPLGIGTALREEGINATLSDIRGIGNSLHNMASGNLQGAAGRLGVFIYEKYIDGNEAARIDSYFDRFGYAWQKTELVNTSRCSNYDFIKTNGMNVQGTIPAKDKAKINAIFDAGITVWHNAATYGDYSAGPRG